MRANPSDFLRFLSDHFELVAALIELQPFSRAQLNGLVDDHRPLDGLTRETIVARMSDLGLLDDSLESRESLEVPVWICQLVNRLQGMLKPSGAPTLRAKLEELDSLRQALHKAGDQGDENIALEVNQSIDVQIEDIRADARDTLGAVRQAVAKFKMTRDVDTLAVRYFRVRHLWESYVAPLGDLIDQGQSAEFCFERLTLTLRAAEDHFREISTLAALLLRTRQRLNRTREQLMRWHLESVFELRPLYTQLRKDHEVAQGASIILQNLVDKPGSADAFAERLAMPSLRASSLGADGDIHSFLLRLRSFSSRHDVIISTDSFARRDNEVPIDWRDALELLRRDGTDDVLRWLCNHYSDRTLWALLKSYATLIASIPDLTAADSQDDLSHDRYLIRYHARTVTLADRALE